MQNNGSIWWLLWCPEVWGGGRRMRGAWLFMQFSLCYDMYTCSKAQLLLLHKCHQSANKWRQEKKKKKNREAPKRRVQEDTRVPTFEGDENTRCCQWLVEDGVPHSKAGQGQEGVDRPQTAQLHLWPTSCGARGLIWSNLCRDNRWIWVSLRMYGHAASLYGFMWWIRISGSQGPHQQEIWWLGWDIEELHKQQRWICCWGFQRWVSESVW